MMKVFSLFIFITLSLCANENPMILLPWAIGFLVTIGVFFWGIYKAIKTHKSIYMLTLIPVLFLMIAMFLV